MAKTNHARNVVPTWARDTVEGQLDDRALGSTAETYFRRVRSILDLLVALPEEPGLRPETLPTIACMLDELTTEMEEIADRWWDETAVPRLKTATTAEVTPIKKGEPA